jgi:hypothetical protein
MVRFGWACLGWLLLVKKSVADFRMDVIHSKRAVQKKVPDRNALNNELLRRAIPIAEYEAKKFDVNGNHLKISEYRRELQEGDDFYVEWSDMYSLSGYSLKYATCQPVQYFSEDAILAGEHSPMITQDIVILRLCPQKSCSSSAQYGCHYNYAEYALAVEDYLEVMLSYSATRRDKLCGWCAACGVVYQGNNDDAAADDGQAQRRERRYLEDVQNDDAAAAANQDGGEDAAADAEEGQDQEYVDCTNVDTYCTDYDNECGDPNAEGDGYLDFEEVAGYLRCVQVNYNDHAYFVRPRCDGTTGLIKMAVYYDNYCVQYAGGDVSVKDLGLGFREGQFQNFTAGTCIDCSKTGQQPFYDINSALCNNIHASSAKCASELLYDLFGGTASDSTECSFIESIRFGTYDEEGKLSSATNGVTWTTEVSKGQKIMLGLSIAFVVVFIIYSCYLHHSMTNLLIKSLSHRELLPPSRKRVDRSHRRRGSNSSRTSRGSKGSDEDWEKPL